MHTQLDTPPHIVHAHCTLRFLSIVKHTKAKTPHMLPCTCLPDLTHPTNQLTATATATPSPRRVNGNLNLSRAIGDLKYKNNTELPAKDQIITAQPDIRRVTLTPEDRFFVLACDGVWDVMSNQVCVCVWT